MLNGQPSPTISGNYAIIHVPPTDLLNTLVFGDHASQWALSDEASDCGASELHPHIPIDVPNSDTNRKLSASFHFLVLGTKKAAAAFGMQRHSVKQQDTLKALVAI